jgi:hypothetical protein
MPPSALDQVSQVNISFPETLGMNFELLEKINPVKPDKVVNIFETRDRSCVLAHVAI